MANCRLTGWLEEAGIVLDREGGGDPELLSSTRRCLVMAKAIKRPLIQSDSEDSDFFDQVETLAPSIYLNESIAS